MAFDGSDTGPGNGAPAAPAGDRSHRPLVVLLAEDDNMIRRVLRLFLTRRGHTVIEASDGEQALARTAEFGRPIDVLLTDIAMPNCSGGQLVERLRQRQPGVPCVAITGSAAHPDIPLCEELGVRVLRKPLSLDQLYRALLGSLASTR